MKTPIDPTLSLERFLRESEVRRVTGLSRSQRQRLERAGQFPARVRLSDRAFGWIEGEIRQWVATRVFARAQSQGRAANVLEGDNAEEVVGAVRNLAPPGEGHGR